MTTKFTPKPWHKELCHHKDAINVTAISRDGFIGICDIGCGYEGQIEIEQQANAHLIAASPELYEALENLFNYLETDDMKSLDMNKARFALAKARGES